jgi:hypothetical protein
MGIATSVSWGLQARAPGSRSQAPARCRSLSLVLEIPSNGEVSDARVDRSDPSLGSQVVTCVAQSAQRAHFTAVDAGTVKGRVGLAFTRPADDTRPEPGGLRGYGRE